MNNTEFKFDPMTTAWEFGYWTKGWNEPDPTLWTPSYFVSTAGNISTEAVKNYIAQQRE